MIPGTAPNYLFEKYGEIVEVYAKVEVGDTDFNNTKWDWRYVGKSKCVVSNTTDSYRINESGANYDTDEQNFYFRSEEEPPTSDARVKRLEHGGRFFELRSATRHSGHTQYRARKVRDNVPVQKHSDKPYEE